MELDNVTPRPLWAWIHEVLTFSEAQKKSDWKKIFFSWRKMILKIFVFGNFEILWTFLNNPYWKIPHTHRIDRGNKQFQIMQKISTGLENAFVNTGWSWKSHKSKERIFYIETILHKNSQLRKKKWKNFDRKKIKKFWTKKIRKSDQKSKISDFQKSKIYLRKLIFQ